MIKLALNKKLLEESMIIAQLFKKHNYMSIIFRICILKLCTFTKLGIISHIHLLTIHVLPLAS